MRQTDIEKSQSWTMALRTLMGYPADAPPFHTVAWCVSSPRDLIQLMDLACFARDSGRDVVHVAFEFDADEPIAISMAVHRDRGIEWLPNVLPYAPNETSKIELLADRRRWHIGPRHNLTSAKLPATASWESGIAIARRRWRQAAATMKLVSAEGSMWVPDEGSYADAIAHKSAPRRPLIRANQ